MVLDTCGQLHRVTDLPLLVYSAKVQNNPCASKFRPSNWPDFDEEFIEIAHARQNSCEHDSVLA